MTPPWTGAPRKCGGMPDALTKRRMLANLARGVALGYSSCYRCGMPWKFTEGHATFHSGGHACFPLCESCWAELTPDERLPFYERLIDDWNGKYGCPVEPETAQAIREAVMAGG